MSRRCEGITQKNRRCRHKTSNASGFCAQHEGQIPKQVIVDELRIPDFCITTIPRRALDRVSRKLRNPVPSKSDGPGYIYSFRLIEDEKIETEYHKIGRTVQRVKGRMSQWKAELGTTPILDRSWNVKHQKFAERLIHLLLDGVRIYRYQYKRDDGVAFHSIWKNSGNPVRDAFDRTSDIEAGDYKPDVTKKHVEWFAVSQNDLFATIEYATKIVNNLC